MIVTRILSERTSAEDVLTVVEHVQAELSASAAADDDPTTYADQVEVYAYPVSAGAVDSVTGGRFEHACIVVRGTLDLEPDAPYLKVGYDASVGVSDDLLAEAYNDDVEAMP